MLSRFNRGELVRVENSEYGRRVHLRTKSGDAIMVNDGYIAEDIDDRFNLLEVIFAIYCCGKATLLTKCDRVLCYAPLLDTYVRFDPGNLRRLDA